MKKNSERCKHYFFWRYFSSKKNAILKFEFGQEEILRKKLTILFSENFDFKIWRNFEFKIWREENMKEANITSFKEFLHTKVVEF
jgi:hypothetical protein